MNDLLWAFKRDLALAWRSRADIALVPIFFLVVVSLFPLAIGPEARLLTRLASGVIWVSALLSALLAAHRLFAADFADGSLEQAALPQRALVGIAFGKICAHWVATGVPIVLLAPLVALQYGLPSDAVVPLVAGLALGTPVLSALVATGAALTLGLRAGGALLALLTLPLMMPILIFGAGAAEAAAGGLSAAPHLSLLGAALLLALAGLPWPVAAALRLALD